MALTIIPIDLFNPPTVKVSPRPTVIDGGTAINGEQDVIETDRGGRWAAEFSGISINSPALERRWRQWDAYLSGGARVVAVPCLTIRTAPRPHAGRTFMRTPELYKDDPLFPTVVRYASPYIVANAASALAVGGVQMVITISQGARLEGGEVFSINHRAYVIERVVGRSGQSATVIINPPARAAIANGAALNFEWPTFQGRLAVGQDLAAAMEFRYGTVSMSFVEDFSDAG